MTASPPAIRAPKPWLWPNLLSLDAPAVAVLWQALFVRCFRARLEPQGGRFDALAAVLLSLTVWLIYSADRLLDAWTHSRSLARHEFHARHWRAILPTWIAACALAGWLAFRRLPDALFARGLAILTVVAIYFAVVHLAPERRWPKELAVAILFAAGVSLAAWKQVQTPADLAAIAIFGCLCWINCAAIERWERDTASAGPIRSLSLVIGILTLILLRDRHPVLASAEAISAFAFAALDGVSHRLSPAALRVLADVALLTPVLFLPLLGMGS